jgi:hypothetical protein
MLKGGPWACCEYAKAGRNPTSTPKSSQTRPADSSKPPEHKRKPQRMLM